MNTKDVVDRIDELVDDQLAAYDERSGYDHNVNQHECPHCGDDWHGLKITSRMAAMRASGRFDPGYSYADDDSVVLCEGSEFIGPPRPEPRAPTRAPRGAHWMVTIPRDTTIIGWDVLGAPDDPRVFARLSNGDTVEAFRS